VSTSIFYCYINVQSLQISLFKNRTLDFISYHKISYYCMFEVKIGFFNFYCHFSEKISLVHIEIEAVKILTQF
jgi:hypothetical protein